MKSVDAVSDSIRNHGLTDHVLPTYSALIAA